MTLFQLYSSVLVFIIICTPSGLFSNTQYRPYEANPFEGRVGIIGQPADEKLRLDIGMTYDLFDLYQDTTTSIKLGTDWMVWTRLQSEGRFKFPVETSDYWFGLNFTLTNTTMQGTDSKSDIWGMRLRVAHISSHLVDGYTARSETEWQFLKTPFVYSREFAELSAYYVPMNNLRVYVGGLLLFSTIPDGFSTLTPQLGMDYMNEISILDGLQVRAGYDFKLVDNLTSLIPTHAFQIGLGYFSEQHTGVFVGLYGYDGASLHGMFFMEKDSYIGIGSQVYFY